MLRISLLVFTLSLNVLISQNIDGTLIDIIRYSSDNKIVNTRSAGLGFSYMGILNDVAAVHYNPAGLSLNNKSEISFGYNFNNNSRNSEYLNNSINANENNFNLTNISISSPVRANYQKRDLYYIGISYSNSLNYDQLTRAEGFNPFNSYIKSESGVRRQWTERTKLSQNGITNISDSLYQDFNRNESGLNHDLTFALASEYYDGFSFGGSINFSFGNYNYTRILKEVDTEQVYQEKLEQPPYLDFNNLLHTLQYEQDYTSISFNLGALYTFDNYRFSLNVRTPATIRIEENFYEEALVEFDDNSRAYYDNLASNNTTLLEAILPWSIAIGSSYNSEELTISTAFQYKYYPHIQFLDHQSEYLNSLNESMSLNLDGNMKLGVGAEYQIPFTIIQLRLGTTFETSPIANDNSISILYSGGMGLFLFETLRIDGFVQFIDIDTELQIYDSQLIKTNDKLFRLGLGITYRY